MTDYAAFPDRPELFGKRAELITPSDTTDLTETPKAVMTTDGGDVVAVPTRGASAITMTGLPSGYVIPFLVRRVDATGTTATVVAIYD